MATGNWKQRIIRIGAGVSKKVAWRNAEFNDTAIAWLEHYKQLGGTTEGKVIKYANVEQPRRRLEKHCKVEHDLAEGQASVTLPRYGSRPELNAPFLPSKKVKQLLNVVNTLQGVDLNNLSYEINCYIPRRQAYREERPNRVCLSQRAGRNALCVLTDGCDDRVHRRMCGIEKPRLNQAVCYDHSRFQNRFAR